MTAATWPDFVIALLLIVGTVKGFVRGFVAELGGVVAVIAGVVAPWYYNGAADAQIEAIVRVPPPTAHVIGQVGTGIAAYVVVLVVAAILGRIAKLPLLGIGNALGGALVGFAKAAVLVWMALFAANLLLPASPLKADLGRSKLATAFSGADAPVEALFGKFLPAQVRPWVVPTP